MFTHITFYNTLLFLHIIQRIPLVRYWYWSYIIVDNEFSESWTNWSILRSNSCSVKFMWNRFRRLFIVPADPFLKQGNWAPLNKIKFYSWHMYVGLFSLFLIRIWIRSLFFPLGENLYYRRCNPKFRLTSR